MITLLRFAIASGIAIYGVHYMMKFSRITEVTAGVGIGCLIIALLVLFWKPKPKADYIVKYKNLIWKPGEFTRHWLITGDTGVGKTTSGFNPLLHQISTNRPNWGGLILGAKGDEHFFAQEHAAGHGRPEAICVLEVKPDRSLKDWTPRNRYNLISDKRLPYTTHAKNIVDTAASVTSGEQSSFFKPAAQQAITSACELLELLGRPVNLRRVYQILCDKTTLEEHFNALLDSDASDKGIELAKYFDQTFISAAAAEQKEGIVGTIKVYLGFFLDNDIAEVFCSDEPNTVEITDVDQGRILCTAMPQTFQTERRYINTYLKLLFYTHAMMRFDKPKAERKDENLLIGFMDEFQALATASEDGISDHNVIDRLRAANCCLILGMQSDASLFPVLGKEKAQVLTLNCRSRIAFRQPDPEGAEAVAQFIAKIHKKKKSVSSGFMGKDRSTTINKEWDYEVQPGELMKMPDATAWIVHPSKKKIKMRIPAMDGAGKIPDWWK
ncbi:MAG: type IV secretion system DNA-binding domain-containing protein [Verrucomicrobiales bacterium]|nr:type IV secretion system DNA-binding domain-containing protein [Verrucomicrobiales bacterium]